LDEPSAGGLTPGLVKQVFSTIKDLHNKHGMSVLLVEQNIREAVRISQQVYLMREGKAVNSKSLTNVLSGGSLEDFIFQ
jgi:branched-chain amino acid transport system ATP-binding protein